MSFRDDVKQWFQSGDKPTQSQFESLFDKLRFNDESIGIDEVDGLQLALNGIAAPQTKDTVNLIIGNNTVNLQPNVVYETFVFESDDSQIVNLFSEDYDLQANVPKVISIPVFYKTVQLIDVNCAANCTLKIYKKI
jgi:hypothetical protein